MEGNNSMLSSPSPPNPSFRVLETDPKFHFTRSISTKEPSTASSDFPTTAAAISPPRLSLSKLHCSSPFQSFSPVDAGRPANNSFDDGCNYRCISSVLRKDGQILSMALSNNLIYTGSESNVIRVHKLPELTECDQLRAKASRVVALLVSRSNQVCAAYSDNKIRVWQRTWDGGLRHVRVATMPTTGSYVRSYITGKDRTQLKHMGPITSLSINVGKDMLYSASLDTTVKVWRISDFRCIETFKAHSEPINSILAASDGILYTASDDATIRVWHLQSVASGHSLALTLPAKNSPVKALVLTPTGNTLYGGCTDGYIHYWLRAKGPAFACQLQYGGALQGHEHAVLCLASMGNYLVSGSADSTVRIWCKDSDGRHECIAGLVGHRGPVRCVTAYPEHAGEEDGSEDGKGCTVCTGSLDGSLKQWRVMSTGGGSHGRDYFEL